MYSNPKYNLEKRILQFAEDVRAFSRKITKESSTISDIKQLIRASGSIGATYIEAYEALSQKSLDIELRSAEKRVKKHDIG